MLNLKGARRYACVLYQGENDYGFYLAVFAEQPSPGETTETTDAQKQTAKP